MNDRADSQRNGRHGQRTWLPCRFHCRVTAGCKLSSSSQLVSDCSGEPSIVTQCRTWIERLAASPVTKARSCTNPRLTIM